MHIDDEDRVVIRGACDVTGGALRLARRALETHGRDVGCEIGAWIDDALSTVAVELVREDDEVPIVIQQVRQATLDLTQATAAVPEDQMLVPDRPAKSLRHLLVVYVIAERLDGARTTRSPQGDEPWFEACRADRRRVSARSDP